MVAAESLALATSIARPPDEQRMLLHNVGWKEYEVLREALDGPGLRMTYSEGVLELMSPSPEHELWKKNIARFIELHAHLRRIDLRGYGSATFKSEAKQRGVEPDECYLIGKKLAGAPEIVVEVVRTPPLVDKLPIYASLGVREVWIFRDGAFSLYELGEQGGDAQYQPIPASRLLPDVDLAVIARLAMREDTAQALREYEEIVLGR
jgi:Uma2 family endonuclease